MTRPVYYAVPYTMTVEGLQATMAGMRDPRSDDDTRCWYEKRMYVSLSDHTNLTPPEACDLVWSTYQNIDDARRTPDGGRSMMVGDLVMVNAASGRCWYRCASIGWQHMKEPDWYNHPLTEPAAPGCKGKRYVDLAG